MTRARWLDPARPRPRPRWGSRRVAPCRRNPSSSCRFGMWVMLRRPEDHVAYVVHADAKSLWRCGRRDGAFDESSTSHSNLGVLLFLLFVCYWFILCCCSTFLSIAVCCLFVCCSLFRFVAYCCFPFSFSCPSFIRFRPLHVISMASARLPFVYMVGLVVGCLVCLALGSSPWLGRGGGRAASSRVGGVASLGWVFAEGRGGARAHRRGRARGRGPWADVGLSQVVALTAWA